MRTLAYALVVATLTLVALALVVARAEYPRLRVQHLVFRFLAPLGQRMLGVSRTTHPGSAPAFTYEHPRAVEPLRRRFDLDAVVASGRTDFERWVLLMHWARDRFPHRPNPEVPDAQAFDGVALLERHHEGGYLCGTIAPLLVQAVTALGGRARRVELRFTPADSHVVTEVWSEDLGKWAVLDPDYDVYFTADGVPQHALELHRRWATNAVDSVAVHWRDGPNNIYRPDLEGGRRDFLRMIYANRDWPRWDRERSQHKGERFAVRLLHYYTHVSFPVRNDWRSRPLPWWHPEGNHVQGSLVVTMPTMPAWEDFLVTSADEAAWYAAPPG